MNVQYVYNNMQSHMTFFRDPTSTFKGRETFVGKFSIFDNKK